MADEPATAALDEPPTGSAVAIDWGGPRQEVWVANKSNIGCWYTPDIPLRGDAHPHWEDVLRRAEGRTLTLLVPGSRDAYAAGFDAGVTRVASAIEAVVGEMRVDVAGRHPEAAGEGLSVDEGELAGELSAIGDHIALATGLPMTRDLRMVVERDAPALLAVATAVVKLADDRDQRAAGLPAASAGAPKTAALPAIGLTRLACAEELRQAIARALFEAEAGDG